MFYSVHRLSIKVHIITVSRWRRWAKEQKNAFQHSVFIMAGTPVHPHLSPWQAWRGGAAQAHLSQTTWRGLKEDCSRDAGSHLSGGGRGSVPECLGRSDVLQDNTKG